MDYLKQNCYHKIIRKDAISEKRELPESSTIETILSGKSKISIVGDGDFIQNREINGVNWLGKSFQYEVTGLPNIVKPDETRTAYLTVWTPTVSNDYWTIPPETQVYITTGLGEMIFTKDKEIKWQVVDEINRQLEESTKVESMK